MLTELIIIKTHISNKLFINSVSITTTIISIYNNISLWIPDPKDLVKDIISGLIIGIASWASLNFIGWINKRKTIIKIRIARKRIEKRNGS